MDRNHSTRLRVLRRAAALLIVTLLGTIATAQNKPMTNDDVILLVKGGLQEGVIFEAMQNQPMQFDISAQALVALKKAGVSEKIIQRMIAIATGTKPSDERIAPAAPPSAVSKSADEASSAPTVSETTSKPPKSSRRRGGFETDFSAVQYSFDEGGSPKTDGALYVGSGRLRYEESTPAGKVVTIVDPRRMAGAVLTPGKSARSVYQFAGILGSPGNSGLSMFLLPVDPENPCARYKEVVSCQSLGSEDVNGRSVTKWEFIHGIGGRRWSTYEWVDTSLQMAIKRQYMNHVTELRDIKEEAQPAKLFTMPATASQNKSPAIGKSQSR